jgi:hypothetical protein
MRLVPILLLATFMAACAPPRAVDIRTGEACWRCRRPITNAGLAAEFVSTDGTGFASKFRTVHCMATWIAAQADTSGGIFYVRNYATDKWIRADRAVFVRTIVNDRTNERDYMAFETADEATPDLVGPKADAPVGWQAVLAMGREHPMGGN